MMGGGGGGGIKALFLTVCFMVKRTKQGLYKIVTPSRPWRMVNYKTTDRDVGIIIIA